MANTPSKKATAATPSAAYAAMLPRWRLADTLLGGTEAMREAGREYLPQFDNESSKNYLARLQRTTLFNAFELTLNTLAGKPFEDEMILDEGVSEQMTEHCLDIDLQGHNLQAFCRPWFRLAWAKGFAHVLVDFPLRPQVTEGVPRTLADDRKEGVRPFWSLINPENLLAAYATTINGKEVLTHIRVYEETVERIGFEEVIQRRVRVIERDIWQTWVPTEKDDDWVLEAEGANELGVVPLVTFYTARRTGLMMCKPPLHDLAHLNVTHWQSTSDQRNILTVARFPILAAAGVPPDQKVTVGPNNFLTTEDTAGRWYYVEHEGAAIEAGRLDLQDLEDKMAAYGAELLRKKPGTETATGRALDSAEAVSYLGSTVIDFADAIAQCLQFHAMWIGTEDGGSVSLNHDVGLSETQSHEYDSLLKMRANRDISRVALINEMQRRGLLDDEFDPEADAAILKEEGDDALGMFGKEKVVPGQKPPVEDDEGGEV